MRITWAICAAACLTGAWAGPLLAQGETAFERQQRQYQERLRDELDFRPTPEQRVGVDWGGWFNIALAAYEDANDRDRLFSQYDLYLWGRATVQQAHEFYARMRMSFLAFHRGELPGGDDEDFTSPRVDRLYYLFDLRSATLRREKRNLPYNVFAQVGRQYVELGTGLALSMPMDAVVFGGELANVEVKGLLGRTIRSWDNIDRSAPVAPRSDRDFYGVQATCRGLKNHQPFAYAVWQQDHTDEDPEDLSQEYDYDSQYFGFGSRGRLILPKLFYQTELVFERGHSFGYGSAGGQDPIKAMAFDVLVNYLFGSRYRPTATAEYLFASGDDDRRGSPTDTLGGNLPGSDDHSFNGFGFRNTGLAFAPPISNLHMVRLGGSVRPLPGARVFREMVVGTDLFCYLKAESSGAGPDAAAGRSESCLGQELDLYCNWRITSDLAWTIRYGVFFPGDAFSGTRSARNFLFTGFTFSF